LYYLLPRRGNMMINFEKAFSEKKSILILGETGVGKTILVNSLHKKYISKKPIVSINLSGLPDQFFESELYGYKKGSFTGAHYPRLGLLKKAEDGVVFLDEIGDLNPVQQLKILKLIDEKIYYPIGEDSHQVFRGQFIFATHRNLLELVKKGQFREDLYFRLTGLVHTVKPLRMKREKVIKILAPYQERFTDECYEYLCNDYKWPGNFRELATLTDRLRYMIYNEKIEIEMIADHNCGESKKEKEYNSDSYYEALSEFERDFIQQKLRKFSGKINYTSEVIGLSKSTLIAKLRKYGINNLEIKAMSQKRRFLSNALAA
jgi:DNA-binding NtrC family response regulator